MAKSKKKLDSKAFAQQKRHRRQWVTFLRMCRYGINNFTRNAWLTIAATAVMTITLFVIFTSVAARNVLVDTLQYVRNEVKMSIYLETETSEEDVNRVVTDVENLPSVIGVAVVSPSEARDNFARDRKDDPDALEALKESTNQLPWTLNIEVADINNTEELSQYVDSNEFVKERLDRPPSFAGERRQVIENIAGAVTLAQNIGIIASAVLIVISMLIIFNTIRMAIFNRRDEIEMMKLIGAEKSFIRGPFLVEAIVYGFFAAILASVLGYAVLRLAAPALQDAGVPIQPTVDLVTYYAGFVLLGMIVIGAIIGIISSLMATRRHLKL